jgi:hypothetical protein
MQRFEARDAMELDVTTHFVPVFWGLTALLVALFGALVASVDRDRSPSSTSAFAAVAMLSAAVGALLAN